MQAGIGPRQLVMGIDFYGRSFKIETPYCSDAMSPSKAGSASKECLQTYEVLSQAEIVDLLKQTENVPAVDRESAVKHFSWKDQW